MKCKKGFSLFPRSLATLIFVLLPLIGSAAQIFVIGPSDAIRVGERFTVDLVADIPESVAGWGLDLSFDPSLLELVGLPHIGPAWNAASGVDGDGLAGFSPLLAAVTGNDILLASVELKALTTGFATLIAAVTPGDLTEGLPLAFPSSPGSFAPLSFSGLAVTVAAAPVPSTLALLLAPLAMMLRRRPRKGFSHLPTFAQGHPSAR